MTARFLALLFLFLALAMGGEAARAAEDGKGTTVDIVDFQRLRADVEALRDAEQRRKDPTPTVEAMEKKLRDELDLFTRRIEIQDKIVNTMSATTGMQANWFGGLMTAFGVLITVIVVALAFKTALDAKAEARLAAEDHFRSYEKDIGEHTKKLEELEASAKKSTDELCSAVSSAEARVAEISRIHDDAKDKSSKATEYWDKFVKQQEIPSGESDKADTPPPEEKDVDDNDASAMFKRYYVEGLKADRGNDHAATVSAYERAEDVAPDMESRARAMNSKAVSLAKQGKLEDAERVLRRIMESFGNTAVPSSDLTASLSRAASNLGVTYSKLGRYLDAVSAYDDAVKRFGDANEPASRESVAKTLFNKGVALDKAGRGNDAVSVYDDVVARFADATESVLREWVAKSLVNKGVALGKAGRVDDAISVNDDVVARFGNATELALREQVAKALVNKGVALAEAGRADDALSAFDDVVARFANATELALREWVAKILVNKGIVLGKAGRADDALSAYDKVVVRFADATEPALREQVAWALFNKGVALGELGRVDDAVSAYDNVVVRFADATEPALREWVAKALVNKGVTHGKAGRSDDALSAFDDVVARFADATEPPLREQVARALFSTGVALGEAGRTDDAVSAYDNVVARFGDATEPALRSVVEKAKELKAEAEK